MNTEQSEASVQIICNQELVETPIYNLTTVKWEVSLLSECDLYEIKYEFKHQNLAAFDIQNNVE